MIGHSLITWRENRLLYKAQNEVLITEEREDQFRKAMKGLKKLIHWLHRILRQAISVWMWRSLKLFWVR